ncbi:MAG: sigma-70 family RNA polymerase sigma factor [Clostridia bacterium]|nr:sigma-70 family RNA polymerase sigma factor [Clostridia bacterium]
MEDHKLLRLLHKDPNAGMEQLMNQYTGLVYTVVKSKLDNSYCASSDIEDCVADVFSKFYLELSDYDPGRSSIKTYLCVIAHNHAINTSRRRSLESGISLDDEHAFLQVADEIQIDRPLAEDEFRREVIKAVEDLGDPDSSIIFRKYYYGESSKDIAKAVGLTVSNVDTRTHRALNKLRKMFGGNKL